MRTRLGEAVAALSRGRPHVAWVAPQDFHLTLKFLGQVEQSRVEAVVAALAAAAAGHRCFALACAGLGAFPSASRPRVLWAGVAEGADPAARLAAAADRALEALGFPAEPRPFSAHVTLGRVRVPRRDPELAAALAAGRARDFGAMRVERVSLMRSEPTSGGARYSELAAIPLG